MWLLCLASFTSHVFKVHPRCNTCQYVIPSHSSFWAFQVASSAYSGTSVLTDITSPEATWEKNVTAAPSTCFEDVVLLLRLHPLVFFKLKPLRCQTSSHQSFPPRTGAISCADLRTRSSSLTECCLCPLGLQLVTTSLSGTWRRAWSSASPPLSFILTLETRVGRIPRQISIS